ncbi:CTP synthase [Diplocarpon rosae]|nr:CTP synthase [Diplocarpon rosae]
MNVDAGTMAPTEHGEVFVLDDGGEVDLDLGNYERYLNITLTRENNITTGKIYQHVIERERRGDYLGKTVQVVPHLTDAIQDWIERVARIPVDDTNEQPDVCIIELGGTVGDIESAPFIEAMRQLKRRAGKNNFLQIHVSLIPVIQGEQKTKPTQQAIRDVGRAGLVPDLIACRCDIPLEKSTIEKIAMFCQVEPEQVVAVHNVSSTYHVPLLLEEQGLVGTIRDILKLDDTPKSERLVDRGQRTWAQWRNLTSQQDRLFDTVDIVLVGKYTNLHDSYLSVIKSLEHSAMRCGKKLNLIWVDASHLEEEAKSSDPAAYFKAWHAVSTAHGILVPGGFGHRGTEGMILAAEYARTNKTPYLGIFNPEYIARLADQGLDFVGKDAKGERMEILELKDHPWYVGVQFHPEYLSRVLDPSKPYLGFVAAAAGCLEKVTRDLKNGSGLFNGSADGGEKGLVNGMNGVRI